MPTKGRSSSSAALPNAAEWEALVSVANHNDYDFGAGGDVAVRRRGKTILEADRSCYAREAGYRTAMGKLEPLEASPMNDVLLGWPPALGVQLDA